MSFTPGPWRISDGKSAVYAENVRICRCDFRDENDWETDLAVTHANARLMAAAPELLEACKTALTYIAPLRDKDNGPYREFDALRAAVKKAVGE